jgi:hypothetical protein
MNIETMRERNDLDEIKESPWDALKNLKFTDPRSPEEIKQQTEKKLEIAHMQRTEGLFNSTLSNNSDERFPTTDEGGRNVRKSEKDSDGYYPKLGNNY